MASSSNLTLSTYARYAMGSLGTGGFATLPGLVLVYYLTDTLGVPVALAGIAITVSKIWDVIIDPIIGGMSDRWFAKYGTRRRSMIVGSIALPVFFALTFAVPAGLSTELSMLWVTVSFLLAATAFSLFQVPYITLPAEMTTHYDTRTKLLTWRVVILTLAILLFGAGGPELRSLFPGDPFTGYLVMGIVAGIVIGIGFLTASTTAPKLPPATDIPRVRFATAYRDAIRVLVDSQPMRALLGAFALQALATGLMLAAGQYVATWILGDETALTPLFAALIAPALLVTPLWQKVALKIGKERGFMIASALFLLATLILMLITVFPGWWLLAPLALAGCAYAGMQSLPMAMLPDVVQHDTVTRGEDRAGMFGGVWTASETMGAAFGVTLLTIILSATGYVERSALDTQVVTQSDATITAIGLSFSLVPALLVLASMFVFRRYRLRREHTESTRTAFVHTVMQEAPEA